MGEEPRDGFSLNVDGVDDIDIFFPVGFQYGLRNNVYCNWDFMDNDVDKNQEHMEGEFGQGGSGYNYAIVRYDMSDLGSFFPRGQTVDIEPASECQSYNADGS
jgi:hypothetical protein